MTKNKVPAAKFPEKEICPRCGRAVPLEDGWFAKHSEDPPSRVACEGSGTYFLHEAAKSARK